MSDRKDSRTSTIRDIASKKDKKEKDVWVVSVVAD